jgi:hypothetical protein
MQSSGLVEPCNVCNTLGLGVSFADLSRPLFALLAAAERRKILATAEGRGSQTENCRASLGAEDSNCVEVYLHKYRASYGIRARLRSAMSSSWNVVLR